MYSIYCSNYDNAEAVVLKLRKRKDIESQLTVRSATTLFVITHSNLFSIQVCQSDSRVQAGLTLPMYLITPVQRIPRYILLMKVLL